LLFAIALAVAFCYLQFAIALAVAFFTFIWWRENIERKVFQFL